MEAVESVVRDMLDAMRNAHLQMVLGDPQRAIEWLRGSAAAHRRLGVLFHGDPQNEAMAGRILFQVIDQRMQSLMCLAEESLASPLPPGDVVAFVAKPLEPLRPEENAMIDTGDCTPPPTEEPPIG